MLLSKISWTGSTISRMCWIYRNYCHRQCLRPPMTLPHLLTHFPTKRPFSELHRLNICEAAEHRWLNICGLKNHVMRNHVTLIEALWGAQTDTAPFFCKIDWMVLARAQARSLGHLNTRQTGGGWFKEIFSLGVQKFFTAVQLLFMADLGKTSIRQQSLVIWIMKTSGHTLGPWFLKALHIHAMASFHWINDEFYCNFYSNTEQFQVMSSILWIYEGLMV